METFGIEIETRYTGLSDNQFHWSVTLKRANRSYTFKYSAGLAHCKKVSHARTGSPYERMTRELVRAFKPYGTITISDTEGYVVPTAPDLKAALYCIQSDARAGENLLFEDFASEFGYDVDSRKAEEIWKACVRARGELQRLLGSDFDSFMQTDFDSED